MKKSLFNRAFTLIEIMVVVGILAILAAVVYSGFGESRATARDAERKSDLRTIQVAIEAYRSAYERYPEGCNGPGNWSGGTFGCGAGNQYIIGLAPEFISSLPQDPCPDCAGVTSDRGYVYVTNADGSVYKLMAMNTVEEEVVTYCSEFASCDVRNPTPFGAPTNQLDNENFSKCVYNGDVSGAFTFVDRIDSGYTPSAENVGNHGWCSRVPSANTSPPQCTMSTAPFNDPGGNGRFERSYGVWGGVADEGSHPNFLIANSDTYNIICK